MPAVRLARFEDLDKLAAVERSAASMFRDVGLSWVAEGDTMEREALAGMCLNGTLWVALDDDDIPVGFLAAQELDGHFYIAEMSVARSHQRRGLGARLIAAAIEHARASGFETVTLTTYLDLSWNGPFYARLGFTEVDPGAAGLGHLEKLRSEAAAGHDPSRRCVMAKSLQKVRQEA